MSAALDRWRPLFNKLEGSEAWSSDDPEVHPKFLHAFRRHPGLLGEVFRGVVRGDEILERLRRILAVPGVGGRRCVPRRPSSGADARGLAALRDLVPGVRLRAEVAEGEAPEARGELEAEVHDGRGDLVRGLKPEESDALLLEEPLYQLACNADIAHFVLWPLYRRASGLEDPFAPYVELWSAGATVRYEEPDVCRVWIPKLA